MAPARASEVCLPSPMRWKLVVTVLVAVLVVGGGATLVLLRLAGSTGHGATAAARATPTPSPAVPISPAPTAVPTPSASPTPTPTPTPTASVSGACTGSQLDMVVEAAASASGGQEGVIALIGNDGGTACDLSGTLQAQLLGSSGSALPTSQGATPAGQAWLVPDRVALDPGDPQPGEATVTVSWRTGDTAPGVCSGSAPTVGELSLTVPGGGSVTAPVDTYPTLLQGMAPCDGDVQVGTITSVSSTATFITDAEDAANSDIEEEEGDRDHQLHPDRRAGLPHPERRDPGHRRRRFRVPVVRNRRRGRLLRLRVRGRRWLAPAGRALHPGPRSR